MRRSVLAAQEKADEEIFAEDDDHWVIDSTTKNNE